MRRLPPTPSLLSTLNEKQLVWRRWLRHIASMFAQVCLFSTLWFRRWCWWCCQMYKAVAVCYDVGIYHWVIKPENFIVTDGWDNDGKWRLVVVKLTDFGLSTHVAASSGMDCGSAPYMSYECHNNCVPTYSPCATDQWSLGIVLINVYVFPSCWDGWRLIPWSCRLYHIEPWTDMTQGVCL